MAPNTSRPGRSALEDTLGEWLNGNHQATLAELENRIITADTAGALYREMWQDAEDFSDRRDEHFERMLRERDIMLNMLFLDYFRLHIRHESERSFQTTPHIVESINQLRRRAFGEGMYRCALENPQVYIEQVYGEARLRSLARMTPAERLEWEGHPDEIIDLTTEEDTDDEEVIDLTN